MGRKMARSSNKVVVYGEANDISEKKKFLRKRGRPSSSEMGRKKAATRSKNISVFEKKKKKKVSKKRDTPSSPVEVLRVSKRNRIVIEEEKEDSLEGKSNVFKKWAYKIKPENHFHAKIGIMMANNAIKDIRGTLSEKQLKMFSETCFGYFLNMGDLNVQPQVLHYLSMMEVFHENDDELWIFINGVRLKFSIEEFALITGLNCVGECNKLGYGKNSNSLLEKYFVGVHQINRQSVEECFYSKMWQSNDHDAVKIAVLYFLVVYLLAHPKGRGVDRWILDIIDSNGFNNYPWGREVFDLTLDSFKSKNVSRSKKGDGFHYKLYGFPLALQVWFYECCSYSSGKLAVVNGDFVPRLLKWSSYTFPRYDFLQKNFFSKSAETLNLKNITPTVIEREKLKLEGFFNKGKEKSDFASGASTSIEPYISSMQFKDSVGDIILKLLSNQEKLAKDFYSFQMSMEKKSSDILQCLSDINMKLQSNLSGAGIVSQTHCGEKIDEERNVGHENIDKNKDKDDDEVEEVENDDDDGLKKNNDDEDDDNDAKGSEGDDDGNGDSLKNVGDGNGGSSDHTMGKKVGDELDANEDKKEGDEDLVEVNDVDEGHKEDNDNEDEGKVDDDGKDAGKVSFVLKEGKDDDGTSRKSDGDGDHLKNVGDGNSGSGDHNIGKKRDDKLDANEVHGS